ncbi:hypothetical protein [Sediminitomix flava]|uniref:Lipoprotein n=1 Tax=Sediminitomix flava TaxID=379075 RepID=A0A315ZHB6_SEDFL|nr:hypothetical protein [Sediminitomix flava]PWJ44911.1 hypothetical protein BC781_1011300 [Sediminitomix flava]
MKKLLLSLLVYLNLIPFMTACFMMEDCEDGDAFDFQEITLSHDFSTIRDVDHKVLAITFHYDQVSFHYTQQNHTSSNVLMASDCMPPYDQYLFPLENVIITSNSDFNDDYPAGMNLIPLFKTASMNTSGDFVVDEMNNFEMTTMTINQIWIEELPTSNKAHQFTITLVKSNEEQVSAVTETIIWP